VPVVRFTAPGMEGVGRLIAILEREGPQLLQAIL